MSLVAPKRGLTVLVFQTWMGFGFGEKNGVVRVTFWAVGCFGGQI